MQPDAGARVIALPGAPMMDSSPPTPPSAGASAPKKGGGAAPKAKKAKAVDWGVVNRLMANFALIYGTDTVWDGESRRIVKVAPLRLAFGNDAVKLWLANPARRMIDPEDLVFEPGETVEDPKINMFDGFELESVPCTAEEVGPMLKLARHLCSVSAETADEVDEIVHWVLCWCALPLQKPGTKMQTALVFHGPQGTGKNLFFDAWRDLYGRYGVSVGQTELEDKFNDWISCKLAIVGDEVVSRQEMYHQKNTLKRVVTQRDKFPIRAIQQSVRWESNHANVVFLSNENQPLALEERDRRYMVVYTPTADDTGLYEEVAAFLDAGGAAKWLHYLQHYELGAFTAHTKPVMTKAKADLIELGWKPSQRFAHEWLGGFLPLPVRVCSAEQLFRAYVRWASQRGERFTGNQADFTKSVERWVMERQDVDEAGRRVPPRLVYKHVAVKQVTGERKTMRCWLPTGVAAPDGVSEGEWAAAGIDAFEAAVQAFARAAMSSAEESA